MFEYFRPRDYIAIITLLCGFYLMVKGIDHTVGAILATIIAYYFGRRIDHEKK